MSDTSSGAGSQIPADNPEQLAIEIIKQEEEAAKSDRGGMYAIKAEIGNHISDDIIFRNRVGNIIIGKSAFLGGFGSRATGREPEAAEKFLPNYQGNIAIVTLNVYTNSRTECTSNTFIMEKSAGGHWLVRLWYNLPCPT
jgi:hypothetical protein